MILRVRRPNDDFPNTPDTPNDDSGMSDATFDQLETAYTAGGTSALLDRLVADLREQGKYHELFDALLLQASNFLLLRQS